MNKKTVLDVYHELMTRVYDLRKRARDHRKLSTMDGEADVDDEIANELVHFGAMLEMTEEINPANPSEDEPT